MLKKIIIISTFVICSMLLSGLSHASVLSPVYRFWSDSFKHHFYTMSEGEKDNLICCDANWNYEHIAWYTWPERVSDTSPIYRFWSDVFMGHFYTMSEGEKDNLICCDANWSFEGIAWYAWPVSESGTSPIYRFWSDVFMGHFYTMSEGEKDNLICCDANWRYEHIAYYAVDKSIFKIHISHLSLPSSVSSDSVVQGSVKYEEGDFGSIGEAQAVAMIPTATSIILTMSIKSGGLNLTGDTINLNVYIPPDLSGSGIIWVFIVDYAGHPSDILSNVGEYIVSNMIESNITITSFTNQTQEFSAPDDFDVLYEFLPEDGEIIKDGVILQHLLTR